MNSLSGIMDVCLSVLVRSAAELSGDAPPIAAVQGKIVAVAQTLEAVRIAIAHQEGTAPAPDPAPAEPCIVVDFNALRAARRAVVP